MTASKNIAVTIILIIVIIVVAAGAYYVLTPLCHYQSYTAEGKVTNISSKVLLTDASGNWETDNIELITLNNNTTYYFDTSVMNGFNANYANSCYPVNSINNLFVSQLIGHTVKITYVNQTYGLPGHLAINMQVIS